METPLNPDRPGSPPDPTPPTGLHPQVRETLRFFEYGHLPKGRLRDTSRAVSGLAREMAEVLPQNAELAYGLRKLLEAKDCLVRACLVAMALLMLLAGASPAQDWQVWPGVVQEVATGERTQTGAKNALAYALMESGAGDVIEIHGNLSHVNVCLGESYRANDVVREEPIRATIVGGSHGAKVRGFSISDKGGGAPYLRLQGFTIDARGSQVGVIGYMDAVLGHLEFVDLLILSGPSTKWAFRIQGYSEELDFIRVRGWDGGQEHLIYVDHPRTSITIRACIAREWGRTLAQVVTREQPGSPGITRPPATGNLTIEDCEAYDCGWDGAFNYTVTGWPNGSVFFRNNHGESRYETGLFVCYYDIKQGDLLTAEGFAAAHLVWAHNVAKFPNGSREANGIGSVGRLEVRVGDQNAALQLTGNTAFDLSKNGRPNGLVELQSRVSPWDWNIQAPRRFREHKTTLDQDAVEALWVR